MLNDTSKQGIVDILSSFDDNALFSLATTTTQGLLKNKITSREAALNAILNYTPDALSFLRRKAITREALFSYLHKKNIGFDLPATKIALVQTVAQLWNIHYIPEEVNSNATDEGSVSELAEQFTRWFYPMLNRNECINHEHFYLDAKLQINISNAGQVISDVVENDPQEIVRKLFQLRMTHKLFFNPNVTGSGVQGRVNPHGLVVVLVCGTLHAEEACVGVFEQVFGLVRDPQAKNNWKIKNCEVYLKSQSGVTAMPTLDTSYMLSLPQN